MQLIIEWPLPMLVVFIGMTSSVWLVHVTLIFCFSAAQLWLVDVVVGVELLHTTTAITTTAALVAGSGSSGVFLRPVAASPRGSTISCVAGTPGSTLGRPQLVGLQVLPSPLRLLRWRVHLSLLVQLCMAAVSVTTASLTRFLVLRVRGAGYLTLDGLLSVVRRVVCEECQQLSPPSLTLSQVVHCSAGAY